jgi:hypothetical protein
MMQLVIIVPATICLAVVIVSLIRCIRDDTTMTVCFFNAVLQVFWPALVLLRLTRKFTLNADEIVQDAEETTKSKFSTVGNETNSVFINTLARYCHALRTEANLSLFGGFVARKRVCCAHS